MTAVATDAALRSNFETDGFVVLRDWLDVAVDVRPLQRELGELIDRVARAFGATYSVPSDPADFDRGYLELVDAVPEIQPVVYDMAKNLVAFQRLIVNERLTALFRTLRDSTLCGTAPGSSGVRIDRPGRTTQLIPWHQELAYQFRSRDAVTFWIPLVPVTTAMGPVVLARGSHREGPLPLLDTSGSSVAEVSVGNYSGLHVADEATIGERFELCASPSLPGDIFAFDFCTLHASAANSGARARWTAQIRYFNFDDRFGASIRWAGGLKHGTTLADANRLIARAQEYSP